MEITELPAPVFCRMDWAEAHRDVALVDASGKQLAKQRIGDEAAGFAQLATLLTEHGDSRENPIPVAIETSRSLLVAALRATGRPVCAINPWRWPATASGTPSHGRSPTPSTRPPWPTSCASTCPPTVTVPPTPNSPRPSRCWPALSRMSSGTALKPTTNSAPNSASSTPRILAAFADKGEGSQVGDPNAPRAT